jgi:outer membrane protein insertion porin family
MRTRAAALLVTAMTFLLGAAATLAGQAAEPEWYVSKPITEFTFKGLVTVKADDLKAIVKPYVGKSFSVDPLLWEIEAKLYALDYFETIVPNALPADEAKTGVVIEFTVKERPTVVAVQVKGNASVRTNEILDKALTKRGDLANQTRLQSDTDAVKAMYLDKGYAEATVTAAFVPTDKDGEVNAVFTVSEGAPTTIKEIRFSGNSFASESTLRGLLKTKPQSLFESGVFQESKLEEDKKAVEAYYTDHGYVDAKVEKVTRDIKNQQGRNYLVLTVYVSEGEQWLYGGLTLTGNKIFSTDRLAALVYQKPGKVLSLQKLEADIGRIQNLYWENGYIFNSFQREESRDQGTRTISFTLNITELDKAHIENIIFKGNTRTAENVLRRGLAFEEGDIFNREKILQGFQYLQNLQYFKTIAPDTQQGSAFGLMNVIFNLEETSTADINFGVTFSGGTFPVSGTIKWNERNFRGQGQTISVDLEASPIKQTVALSYYEPWLFNMPWAAGISLTFDHEIVQNVLQDILPPIFTDAQSSFAAPDPYSNRADYLADVAAGRTIPAQYLMTYDLYNFSLGASTGYVFTFPWARLGFQASYNPTLRWVYYDPALYRPFEISVRQNNNTWNFIDQVTVGVRLDSRDIYWNPTRGYYVGQSFTYAGGFLFGDRDFIRADSRLEGFLTLLNAPITDTWNLMFVFAAHSALSLLLPNFSYSSVDGWGFHRRTDDTEQLYIDGMTVGRGWNQLYVYGNALWDNKVELRMPIVKEAVWLVGFFDAAALLDEPWSALTSTGGGTSLDTLKIDDFLFSYGFGIRFTIPQFPLRFYLAKGFMIRNGQYVEQVGTLNLGGWTVNFVISLGGDTF